MACGFESANVNVLSLAGVQSIPLRMIGLGLCPIVNKCLFPDIMRFNNLMYLNHMINMFFGVKPFQMGQL